MSNRHILVVGAGIAGPVLTFWLAKAGFKVTLIERTSGMFKSGQGIDVEGPAREVVRRMNLEQEIKARTTGEEGFALIDDDANEIASIGGGLTRSLEIMRGDLAEVFVNAATGLQGVEMLYNTQVMGIKQCGDKVTVTMIEKESKLTHEYDAVIGADGLRSKTRRLILDPSEADQCFKPRDQYIAYFTIPRQTRDAKKSRWQNAVGGRSILVRPAHKDTSSAYLNVAARSEKLENALNASSRDEQKAVWTGEFRDVGGEAPRVLEAMRDCDDFYFERIAQVKLSSWSDKRVALVGDAAYAPSPITGEGTNLALVGSYILAGEMSEHPDDPARAFKRYEERCRGLVDKAQKIPLGGVAPKLANPDTSWGIWILRTLFAVLAWSGIWKLADPGEPEAFDLPRYSRMDSERE